MSLHNFRPTAARAHCLARAAVAAFAVVTTLAAAPAWAQRTPAPARSAAPAEGGLYIAGAGFSFQVAAERALRQNPRGQRFFVLTLPPETAALTTSANQRQTTLRERVLAAGGVLLVCQRDIDNRRINLAVTMTAVVAVRGFPPLGSNALPDGERYFAGEDRSSLPAANEALRTLRSTCA